MKRYQAHLNLRYSQLCQQLGDLEVKRDQIEDAIEDTKRKIKMLNDSHPILNAIEEELTKESKPHEQPYPAD